LPPSSRNKAIDKELDKIVLQALARDVKDRYENAMQMKDDLDRYLDDETGDTTISRIKKHQQAATEQTTLLLLKRSINKNGAFPAMGNNISQIMKLTNGQGCAEKLADIILRDLSLSSKILSIVNSSSYGQFGGEINTISRAVVILGLNQIQSLSISFMVFEKLNNGPMVETLKSNTCQSYLSAIFAKKLAANIALIDSEEAFLASMFYNLGKQIVIYFLPDEYDEILKLVIDKGIGEDNASKRVLGINFATIGQFMANEWKLPKNVIYGIQAKPHKISRKPTETADYLAQISSFTNEIVQAASCGNNVQADKALAHVIKRYKATFSLSHEKIVKILDYLFNELIAFCDILGINKNQNTFCKNFIAFTRHDYEFSEEDEVEATEDSDKKKNFNEAILTYGIARIVGMMFKQYKFPDLLNIVVNTLQRGLECEHAILFLRDSVNGEMMAQAGAGSDISTVMKRFHFHENANSDDIFNQSINKQTDTFIPDVTHSPLIKKIPDWCKKVTYPKNLLIYPLYSKKTCVGLLYIDNARALSSKSKPLLEYIDTLRKQTAIALQQQKK